MILILSSNIKDINGLEIKDGSLLTVGRAEDNKVVINASTISSHHARIYVKDLNAYIEDLGSNNGTYIFGKKLEPNRAYPLKDGDMVLLASQDISFNVKLISDKNTKKTKLHRKDTLTLGRNPNCDIVINIPVVSSEHLTIKKTSDGWYIYDNNSTNGTYLNSLSNRIRSAKLQKNQILYLGNYKLSTNRIINYIESIIKTPQDNLKIDNSKSVLTIGRDKNSNIYISHPTVSSKHALLIKENEKSYIKDLKSRNGTYVNNVRVEDKMEVTSGDVIQLGGYSFKLSITQDSKPSYNIRKEFLDGWSIEAKDISLTLPNGRKLLDDISFTVNPGELVGLMGLSGAGKTTLLLALNGYSKPTSGTALINGLDLYEHFDMLKTSIGYVPQDDIIHPELTVREALKYYAKLRLPSDMSDGEIDSLINETLKKLGLSDTADVVIGSPETKKGISGGQRKRVNLAMELLSRPKVIFLDEPTSGLSAVDTKMVMEQLRKLADEGITIIITIHQPSLDNYKFMDNQIILSYGKLAYYGPTYPNSINFFTGKPNDPILLSNPDNALIYLNKKEVEVGEDNLDDETERNKKGMYWKNKYKSSKEYQEFVVKRSDKSKPSSKGTENNKKVSFFRQLGVFTSRYIRIKLKDIVNTSILLIQAPLIAVMVAMLFSEKSYMGLEGLDSPMSPTMLFVIAISSIWFGTINASREIVSEKAIFNREQKVGVSVLPYILSKFIILAVLCFIQSLMLVGVVELITSYSLGFGDDFINIVLITFLTSLSGLSIGLLVSTIAKSQAQALALIPLVLLPMIIFGGGMISVKKMESNSNKISYYISQVVPTRWALEEMIKTYDENDDEEKVCKEKYEKDPVNLASCKKKRDFIKNYYGDNSYSSKKIYIILTLFILVPLFIVGIILYRRGRIR